VAQSAVLAIRNVVKTSKNLKDTCIKFLKEAVDKVSEAVEDLHQRTATEENRRLQRENARLRGKISYLKKENKDFHKEMEATRIDVASLRASLREATAKGVAAPSPHKECPSSSEELKRNILEQLGVMVSSRIEALVLRLGLPLEGPLRPPLEADKKSAIKTANSNGKKDKTGIFRVTSRGKL
jgi:regulator of replication initiation timing